MSAGRFFNDGQELVYDDLNKISAAMERQLWQRAVYYLIQKQTNAFFGDSFLTSFAGATSVSVNKGLGLQSDLTQVSPETYLRPMHLVSPITLQLTTPDPSLPRIDLVVVQNAIQVELTAQRNFKDATSGNITQQTLTVQNDWVANVQIVTGTPATNPVAPAVPAGFVLVATLQVAAVTGLANASSITDNRVPMPLGSYTQINTQGFVSLQQGTFTVQQVAAQIDQLLQYGSMTYFDLVQNTQAPAKPAAGKIRVFNLNNINYTMNSAGVLTPLGSGGGGGSALRWNAPDGLAPYEQEEYGERVFAFENTFAQKITSYLKVPASYIKGRPITLYIDAYSPSSSGNWQLQATIFLFRQNLDAVSNLANNNVVQTGDFVNSTGSLNRLVQFTLSAGGSINGYAVSPGDLLRIELTRVAAVTSASEDSNDIRVIPTSTEVTFA